jgi:NADP-dependent 3-hydroxy acid dehydrogenase YdfG
VAREFGGVDVMVNNAGVMMGGHPSLAKRRTT